MKEIQIFRNKIQNPRWNKFQIRRNEIQIKMPQFLGDYPLDVRMALRYAYSA